MAEGFQNTHILPQGHNEAKLENQTQAPFGSEDALNHLLRKKDKTGPWIRGVFFVHIHILNQQNKNSSGWKLRWAHTEKAFTVHSDSDISRTETHKKNLETGNS